MSNESAAPTCEHYWAWVSPAGTSRSARLCQLCHQPDAAWLNHTVEVDLGCGNGCLDCEFADTPAPALRDALGVQPHADDPQSRSDRQPGGSTGVVCEACPFLGCRGCEAEVARRANGEAK